MNIFTLLLTIAFARQTLSNYLNFSNDKEAKEFQERDGLLNLDITQYPFGDFHYNKSLIGALHYESIDGCKGFKIDTDTNHNTFLMLDKSNCSAVIQATNAQEAGASLLLIINDDDIDPVRETMANKQEASLVAIPVIKIPKIEGIDLKNYIAKKDKVMMEFKIETPLNKQVILQFYINIRDTQFLSLIGKLQDNINSFKDNVETFFVLMKSKDDKGELEELAMIQRMVSCLNKTMRTKVFTILGQYALKCTSGIESKCFEDIVNAYAEEDKAKATTCIRNKREKLQETMNSVDSLDKPDLSYLLINQWIYLGSLNKETIFNTICGSFEKSPCNCVYQNERYHNSDTCHVAKEKEERNRTFVIIADIIIILLLLFLAGCLFVSIYNKIYKRILNERIKQMVADSLDSYDALKLNE